MQCYYEVLNVDRNAVDCEIRSAYKKLALKWHPDKNLEDIENAKQQFLSVQQAYDVLSDRQERAWYDTHREQILRGPNSDFKDNNIDVFQYFSTTCFKGYGDDDNGFYSVYRQLFEQITKEDMEFCEDREEFGEVPQFGNSSSDYDAVVGPFYAYWIGYSTRKTYYWLDAFDFKSSSDKRVLKSFEKINKKIRQKAKKERNEEVRNLISFVKRRDKRVQAWNKINEKRILDNRQKQEEIRKEKLSAQKKLNDSHVQAEWTKYDNVESGLQDIEENLSRTFGKCSFSEDDENLNDFYCVACNRVFKTLKSFENHELSKKHRENLDKLKGQMLLEDAENNSGDSDLQNITDDNESEDDNLIVDNELTSSNGNIDNDKELTEIISHSTEKSERKEKKANRKSKNVLKLESEEESECVMDLQPEDVPTLNITSKKVRRKKKCNIPFQESNGDLNIDDTSTSKESDRSMRSNDRKKSSHNCAKCKASFSSKNKLFEHLKKVGHSIHLEPSNETKTMKGKGKGVIK